MNDLSRILIVEDHIPDFELAHREIRNVLKDCVVQRVETRKEYLKALKSFEPDLILSDYSLPDFDGMKALKLAQERAPFTPLIIWTGSISEDTAVDCMKAGATNYILKENIKRLAPAVVHALKERRLFMEHKRVEDELRASEAHFRSFVNYASDAFFLHDDKGIILDANREACESLGYTREELIGMTPFDFDAGATPAIVKQIRARLGAVETVTFDTRHRRKDGTVFPVEVRIRSFEESGHRFGIALVRDITERKQVEAKLQASESRYRLATQATKDVIWEWNPETNRLTWNENAQLVFGYSPEEIGPNAIWWDEHIHPEDRERVTSNLNALTVTEGGESAWSDEYRFLLKNGSYAYIHDHAFIERDPAGKTIRMIGAMSNITERKKAEEAVANSEKRFRALIENGLDDISLLAPDGTLLWESPSTVRNLGYPPDTFRGHNIFELMHPDDLEWTQKVYQELAQEGGRREQGAFRLHRADGTWRWMEAIATNMLNDPSVNAIVINYRDITERKRTEEALREERNLLRTLIDNLPDRIYAMDQQGRKTLSNIADSKASGGKTMEDVIGKTDFDLYPQELAEPFWQADKMVLDSGQPIINFEEPGLDFEGNLVSILTSKIPLRDDAGHVIGLVGVGRDITERKQVESRINDLLAFNEKILNHSPLGILTYKLTGECVFANENAASIVGTSVENLKSQNFHKLETWKKSGLYELVEKAASTKNVATGDFHVVSTFGKGIWMTAYCTTFTSKGEEHVLLSIADISERKRMEEALRDSESKYRALAENSLQGIAIYQGQKIVYANPAMCQINGYTAEELIDMSADQIIALTHPDDRVMAHERAYKRMAGESLSPDFEGRVLRKDGSTVWLQSFNSLIEFDGQPALLSTMIDISQRKQAEIERGVLLDIMQGLANTKDLQEFLKIVHYSLGRVIYAENFFVVLHHEESGLFEEIYSVDQYDPPAPPSSLERSITSYVFRTAEPLLLNQERFDELAAQGEVELVGTSSASWLGIPLKTSAGTIGVMVVQDYENPKRYSERDRDFLASIATQVALAIERKRAEDELRRSHSLLYTTLESTADGILVVGLDRKISSFNRKFLELWQIPDALAAQEDDHALLEFVLSQLKEPSAFIAKVEELYQSPEDASFDELEFHDGRVFERYSPPQRLGDTIVGRVWSFRDITERKHAEAAEREQRVLAEALRDTAQILSSSLDYGEVLDHILTTVGRVVPHDAATIMLIEGEFAQVVRLQGYEQRDTNHEIPGIKLPVAETTNLRQMLETKQPEVVYDTHSYTGWKRLAATDWLRSSVGAPISIYGEVIGFILLDSATPGFFTPVHAERLEAFANQAALAIHNAHLLQHSQQEIAERKLAEDELRQSENRYRTVVESQTEFIVRWRPDGIRTFVNDAYCRYFGLTTEYALSTSFMPSVFEEDRQPLGEKISRLLSGVTTVETDTHRVFKQDGSIGWNEWTDQAIYDHSGQLIEFQSIGRDITERKQAEQELRASEERFVQLANNIEEVFWMTDAQTGKEIYISPAGEKIWGHSLDYLMHEPDAFMEIILPEDKPNVLRVLEKEKRGEKVEMEYRILHADGSVHWIWDRAFPLFDENGAVKTLAGIATDITERKLAELTLQQSQARYYALFDSSPISLWEEDYSLVKKRIESLQQSGVTNLEEYLSAHPEVVLELASLVKVIDINRASVELYHARQKEDLLKNLLDFVSEETLQHFQKEVLGLIHSAKFEWEGKDKTMGGQELMVMVSGSITPGYEEDWSKVIVSINDITERKRAEEEIRQRAKETSALLETSLVLTNLDSKSILQSVGNSAKTLFTADGCRIFLMQSDGETLRCVLALQENTAAFLGLKIKLGDGVTGAVAASGQAEIVNEMQNDPRAVQVPGTQEQEEESIMFAPLKERDYTIGVISIRRAGAERPFQPADLELLEAFASMAASAVSNARLFEEAQQRLSELEALYENGLAVGQLLKPREIGERMIETFARYLSWHHVTIRLLRPGTDELELIAFNLPGLDDDQKIEMEHHFNKMIQRTGQGLSGEAVRSGVPLRTGNVRLYPQYVDTQAGIESGLYMPLKIGDRIIGVISVESETPDAFSEQDERLLATLANQAAIAFENARLYQAAHEEILERTRAQAALWASETHYRELADSITDILFEMDHDLHYTHWNKASEMFSGIPAEDAIGKPMHDLFGTSGEQSAREAIYRSVLTERQARIFETEVFPRGEKRILEINAYPSTRGVSVVARDITERKLNETLMQKRFGLMEYSAHHSLEELMQKTIDEISLLTESHVGFMHFVEDDQKTIHLQAWSSETIEGMGKIEEQGMHYPVELAGVWADAVRRRHSVIHNDYAALPDKKGLPDGHIQLIRELVIPIIRDEKIAAVLGVGNKLKEYTQRDIEIAERFADYAWDITERKQMESALSDERNQLAKRVEDRTADLSRANSNLARALRVKDEFLANMSHELRTPLNAILGLSESLSEQIAGPLNEKQQKYLNTINESGHHLLSLINDILDLAKIEAGQITLDINKVDVNSVCQASLRMIKQLAQKKNQEVISEIDGDVGLMWADERRLKQMIVNLLSNAVKFTPEAGKFGLEVHGDQAGNRVLITVWDKGIGISDRDMERLFKPFVQLDSGLAREASGTGLGLALVAQMARLHGGSVNVESQMGGGSRFTIQLPWEPALAADTATRLRSTGKFRAIDIHATNQPTILLIEDTLEVVMMLVDYLEMTGFKVVTAQDGVEGLEQAKLTHPDLILMDIQMPRMDGFEATQKLRMDPEFKDTPIIALTALAMPNDRQRCLEAGMDEYISKPVNLKALVKLIRSILLGKEGNPT